MTDSYKATSAKATGVLSQDEIDALLLAIDEGVSELPKEIFSKDQIHSLQRLHKTFCRFLSTTLSGYLRTVVDVSLVAVEQRTYEEFTTTIHHNPACIHIFSLRPLEGRAFLEVEPLLAYSIIDRLLGGKGDPSSKNKAFTDIEETCFIQVSNFFFRGLNEAWKTVLEFDMRWEQFENSPPFVQWIAPEEVVILVTCEIKIGLVSGILRICFPYVYLQPILPSLNTQIGRMDGEIGKTFVNENFPKPFQKTLTEE
jgi:flagellar motor switch protein FliM